MKRILFIVNNLIIGGVEKVCWEIVSNLDKNSFQFDFLVAINPNEVQYYEKPLENLGCKIYKSLRIYSKEDKKKFLDIERDLIKKNKYTIVHSHVDFMNIWTLKVAKQEKVPIRISHVHSSFEDEKVKLNYKLKLIIQRFLLRYYSTSRLACSSQAGCNFYGKNDFEVFFNGFNINKFLNINKETDSNKNIVTIGRICDQKNPFFIVDIMQKLLEYDSTYKLYWIGDGHLKGKIDQIIEDKKLEKSIIMLGATNDCLPILKQCTIGLFPSKFEGLGIAIVETQMAKCFTFYSDVVPEEANIGYSKNLSLQMESSEWAKYIHEFLDSKAFLDYSLDFEKVKNYDISETVKLLNNIYKI